MAAALDDAGLTVEAIDYVSAHATGTPSGDRAECEALKTILGSRSREVPVNATKALIGHSLHAAGVVELIAVVLQMRGGFVHGNPGLVDAVCGDLRLVVSESLECSVKTALSNSFGFGTISTSIVVRCPVAMM